MKFKSIYDQLTGDSAITDIVGTRVYHNQPPTDPTLPYVVFKRVSENQINQVCFAGDRWQITCIHDTTENDYDTDLENLKEAIIANLNGFKGTMGNAPDEQKIKTVEFKEAREIPLSNNQEREVSLDFVFRYLR